MLLHSSLLIRDMIHSCSNDEVAYAAIVCIGGEFVERVDAAARAREMPVGRFVAALVRNFATGAKQEQFVILQRAVAGSDQPILSGLRHVVERSLQNDVPSQPRNFSFVSRPDIGKGGLRRRLPSRRVLWVRPGRERWRTKRWV